MSYEQTLFAAGNMESMALVLLVLALFVIVFFIFFFRKKCAALSLLQQHYQSLAESAFEGIILSKNSIMTDCNKRVLEITGYSKEKLLGQSIYMLFPQELHELVRNNINTGYSEAYEAELLLASGERRYAEVRGRTFQSGGDTIRASTVRDISDRRAGDVLLRKLYAAVEHSPSSIVITDYNGTIEYVNPAFTRLTGYKTEEVTGNNPRILKGGDQPEEFYREMWETIKRGEEWRGEFRNRRKDGTLFWEAASISPIKTTDGKITHFVAVKEDVTEKRELLERLEQMAQFDMLTSLPNRRMIMDRLAHGVEIARRNSKRFALLFIDLDGFKRINDTYGHEAGDKVLKTVAARIGNCIRISDTAGRIGGDEFVVILGVVNHFDDAGQVAKKIIASLARTITLPNGVKEHIGASIGISVYPDNAEDGDRLLAAADNAMYETKRSGKGKYAYAVIPQNRGNSAIP